MRRGFSVIELAVCAGVVVITASVVFPVYSNAREKGRQYACTMNLEQIGLALTLYAQDYDDVLPGRWKGWALTPARKMTTWHMLIWPFVRRWTVYVCPSQPPYETEDNVRCSYGLNGCVVGDEIGVRFSEIDLPSDRIMARDSLCCGTCSPTCACDKAELPQVYPHNDGAMCLFADGHIKWYTQAYLRNRSDMFRVHTGPPADVGGAPGPPPGPPASGRR